jgi:PAS domain S-box-containing protein
MATYPPGDEPVARNQDSLAQDSFAAFLPVIVSAAPVGIIAFDDSGNVMMWNSAAEHIFGWRADEVIGCPLPFLTAGNRPEFEQMRAKVRSGITVTNREVRRQRKDGAWIDLSINNAPLYDDAGHFIGIVAIVTDSTEHKRERALVVYQAGLVNTVSDAILSVDLSFRIQTWNRAAARLYGWSEAEALGQISRHLLQTEYLGRSHAEIDRILQEDGAWRGELRQCNRSGDIVLIESSIATIRDHYDHHPIGYVFVNHDVTARKAAEAEVLRLNAELEQRVQERTAQLEATNRELASFAYSVSHDLRAPLRGIDGFSNALAQEYSARLDETGLHYLSRIRSSVERMGGLIDGILLLSRLTRREIRMEAVDMSALAHEVVELQSAQESHPGAEVVIDPDLHVYADRSLLRSLLENLLGNALKFSGGQPAPFVELGKTDIDGEMVYYVRDNGVGFDMAYADKLFSPFQRLHRAGEFPGFGIGLATVQRIVNRHGGRIWAQAAEGAGATFYFTLKRVES